MAEEAPKRNWTELDGFDYTVLSLLYLEGMVKLILQRAGLSIVK